jgi:hypothetical protein
VDKIYDHDREPFPTEGYIVVLQGKGEGCDYTIGCNTAICRLKATTLEEAIEECRAEIVGNVPEDGEENYPYFGNDVEFARVLLINCADFLMLPIDKWKAELKAATQVKSEADAIAQKRALYEKLKAELEPEK